MDARVQLPWHDLFQLHVLRKLSKIINRRWSLGIGYASADATIVQAPRLGPHARTRGLCQVIQSRPAGEGACVDTARRTAQLFAEELRSGDPASAVAMRYTCHAGLSEVAAPIVMEGIYLGCLIAGGFVVSDSADAALAEFDRTCAPLELPRAEVQDARAKHPRLSVSELEYLIELMELCAEEIVVFQSEVSRRERRLEELSRELTTRYSYDAIIGRSLPMQDLYRLLDKVIDSDSTVLVQGENGTGKELIAKAIHYNSSRKGRRFVIQNCSAFNDNLLDSELFGHKKGAFTGAIADKQGLFEVADGGTFFLDEIGDMSAALQVKLLRVLQEGTFIPVGDTSPRKVDVRIIAATNRDLRRMVERGEFREDLYYRINVISLVIPPLRERKDDVAVLVEHFLKKHGKGRRGGVKRLTKGCLDRILTYHWPGNVRELENEIERLVVLAGDEKLIGDELLSPRIRQHAHGLADGSSSPDSHGLPDAIASLERTMIHDALRRHHGNKTRAAAELRISRRNLIRLVQKYKLGQAPGLRSQ